MIIFRFKEGLSSVSAHTAEKSDYSVAWHALILSHHLNRENTERLVREIYCMFKNITQFNNKWETLHRY